MPVDMLFTRSQQAERSQYREVNMSHFAHVNQDNIVDNVIVADQEFINGGYVGDPSEWVQTSYNTRGGKHCKPDSYEPSADQSKALRKNYAGIGHKYDKDRDAFIPPKPFESWVLDEFSCNWESPVPYPSNGLQYFWDEEVTNWVLST